MDMGIHQLRFLGEEGVPIENCFAPPKLAARLISNLTLPPSIFNLPLPHRFLARKTSFTYHLQCPSQNSTDNVRVEEVGVILWEFDKVYERVLVENEGEFITFCTPVRYCWYYPQEHFETNLCVCCVRVCLC